MSRPQLQFVAVAHSGSRICHETGGGQVDFIFMLTRQDRTVADCLAVLDLILPLKLRHIGFKDIGVEKRTLTVLAERIRKAGAISYMEVVSTSPADTLNSARVAVELGIDRLLGGTDVE